VSKLDTLPGRPGYSVELDSRFDAFEEELAALIVPWDSDADCARIAKAHGLPDDARFIAAARSRQKADADEIRANGEKRVESLRLVPPPYAEEGDE